MSGKKHDVKLDLRIAIAVSIGILGMEIGGGILSNSLALLSDSGHVFLDIFALSLSYYAVRLVQQPATWNATYGMHRAEVLAALVNGISLIVVASMIIYFGYTRLLDPPHVEGPLMLVIAAIGLVVNLMVALRIRGYKSLNIKSAYLHVLGDSLSSMAVVAGGVAIYLFQAFWVDPVLSFLIAALIIFGSLRIVFESADILMEKVPRHLAPERLRKELEEVGFVRGVHDLHAWSICSNCHALSVHIVIDERDMPRSQNVIKEITERMRLKHGIEHTTIQIEVEHCGHEQ